MKRQWGEPPGKTHIHDDAFALAGLDFGNAFVTFQPPRGGYDMDPDAIYHRLDLPPSHNYYALYRWLREMACGCDCPHGQTRNDGPVVQRMLMEINALLHVSPAYLRVRRRRLAAGSSRRLWLLLPFGYLACLTVKIDAKQSHRLTVKLIFLCIFTIILICCNASSALPSNLNSNKRM